MKDRIKKFMDYKSISAGELSSILDVQRSNISHILNGRNMPGASFIEKFLISFPDLNARWLLTGTGEMMQSTEVNDPIIPVNENIINKTTEIPKLLKAVSGVKDITDEKPIEKIVVLFGDGTFTDYRKR